LILASCSSVNIGLTSHFTAIKVIIYDSNNDVKFVCNGNFDYVCKENGLPSKALRKSYYNNGKPIYTGNTIKKEVLIANYDFIGWYAVKQ